MIDNNNISESKEYNHSSMIYVERDESDTFILLEYNTSAEKLLEINSEIPVLNMFNTDNIILKSILQILSSPIFINQFSIKYSDTDYNIGIIEEQNNKFRIFINNKSKSFLTFEVSELLSEFSYYYYCVNKEGLLLDSNDLFNELFDLQNLNYGTLRINEINSIFATDSYLLENISIIQSNKKFSVIQKETHPITLNEAYFEIVKIPYVIDEESNLGLHCFFRIIDDFIDLKSEISNSERRFRELFETSTDGILVTDANNNCIDCNMSFLKIIKVKSKKDLLFKKITEIINTITETILDKINYSISVSGSFTDFECEIKDKSGDSVPVILSIWKRTDDNNKIVGRWITVKNNSERVKRLNDIENIANVYSSIYNSINDALVIIDNQTYKIDNANKKALELYGYTENEIFTLNVENVSDGNSPYSIFDAQRYFQIAIETGECNFEWLARHKSGKRFWVNCHIKTIEINGKTRLLAVINDLSEQKKVKSELKSSEEKFRNIFNSSNDSMIIHTIDGIILDLNRQAKDMFGFDDENWKNVNVNSLIAEKNNNKKSLDLIEKALSGELLSFDWIGKKAFFNEFFDVELSFNKLIIDNKEIILTSARDITFRKTSEKQLKNLANRLHLQHKTDKAILGADSEINIMESGIQYLKEYKKCDRVTIIDFNQSDLSLEIKAFASDSETLLKNNEVYPINYFRLTKSFYDGIPIIINNLEEIEKPTVLEKNLLRDGIKSYISIPMIAGTELIGSLNMADKSSDFFNSEDIEMAMEIADSITVAIQQFELKNKVLLQADMLQKIRDIEHNIINEYSVENIAKTAVSNTKSLLNADRASVTIYDFDKDEVCILAVDTVSDTKLSEKITIPLSEYIISDELKNGNIYYIRDILLMDHRRQIDIDLLNEGIRSHIGFPLLVNNKLIGTLNFGSSKPNAFNEEYIQIGSNIAYPLSIALNQAKMRDKIIEYSNNLERLVKDRTNELLLANNEVNRLNQELSKNIVKLISTNKELEAFSYSVSHDLRAPLRAMDGFSEVLIEDYSDQLDESAKEYLNRIRAASQKMALLIEDLLKLSRITRVEINLKDVNISELALEISNELKSSTKERNVEFIIAQNLTAPADESLIRILLNNLIGNAYKFTSKCENAIIEIGKEEITGTEYFYVRDNGAGFDMTYSNKLFRAFQRLHSQTTYEGSGIGLAIAQRIINKHAGQIFAKSEVEKGSTFYFSIGS